MPKGEHTLQGDMTLTDNPGRRESGGTSKIQAVSMAYPVPITYCKLCDGKRVIIYWHDGWWVIVRCPKCSGGE